MEQVAAAQFNDKGQVNILHDPVNIGKALEHQAPLGSRKDSQGGAIPTSMPTRREEEVVVDDPTNMNVVFL